MKDEFYLLWGFLNVLDFNLAIGSSYIIVVLVNLRFLSNSYLFYYAKGYLFVYKSFCYKSYRIFSLKFSYPFFISI